MIYRGGFPICIPTVSLLGGESGNEIAHRYYLEELMKQELKKGSKKCPGGKIRSKGRGRGLGIGKGKGPMGRRGK